MDHNEILKAVTVRITTKDDLRGTGIMYKPKGADHLYVFTAKHCLYGPEFDNGAKRKHLKIDKINLAKKDTVYQLQKGDQIIADDLEDIAVLRINGSDFPEFESIPSIHLAEVDQDRSAAFFKGYPALNGTNRQRSSRATLNTLDREGDKYHVELDNNFLKYYEKSRVPGLCKGFSGSGICTSVDHGIFLQGIVSRFDKAVGFECIALSGMLARKLPELRLLNIHVERYLPDLLLRDNLNAVLAQLKPRYQDLNFRLPIQDSLSQLDPDERYRNKVTSSIKNLLATLAVLMTDRKYLEKQFVSLYGRKTFNTSAGGLKTFGKAYKELLSAISNLPLLFEFLNHEFENGLKWAEAKIETRKLTSLLTEFSEEIRRRVNRESKGVQLNRNDAKAIREFNGGLQRSIPDLNSLNQILNFQHFIGKKYILVKGEAGNGKSQLLGYMANQRQADLGPSILILGQSLVREKSIWSQIRAYCCKEELSDQVFLETLELKGKVTGRPVILFIDAINEGKGIRLWNAGFQDFISAIQPFDYIKVVLSYRTSYERALFRNLEYDETAIVEHRGFEGLERQAVEFFFKDAGLPVPVLPYYSKQFGNPLFLRLFTLLYKSKRGRIELYSWVGTLAVYNHFFEYINELLAEERHFDYDPDKLDLVELAIKKFVKRQLKKRFIYLKYRKAYRIIEKAVRIFVHKKGFFDELVSQGLFYENRYLTNHDQDEPGVDFSYQKLGEYIKTQYLLRSLDRQHLASAISPNGPLFFLAGDFEDKENYQGFMEALTIMTPFYFNQEVFEIWPELLERDDLVNAFLSGLSDRSAATITEKTKTFLKVALKRDRSADGRFWTQLLNFSFQPGNALNTDFIHQYLLQMTLAERDASWGVFINASYEINSAVYMVVNWAMDYRHNQVSDPIAIQAIGKTLFWFLGSNNRQLRDHATKAAVFLFTENVTLLPGIMTDFEKVNDPYIFQRIYAAAFGAVVRSGQTANISTLVQYIYRQIFDQPEVIPDILLRDYARLAVEYGINRGVQIAEPEKIRPPYRSTLLPKAPSDHEIEQYPIELGYAEDSNYAGIHSILHSMVTEHGRRRHMYGDFGRYTFGYAVQYWKEWSDNDLSNLAVQMIVKELGYNHTLSEIDKGVRYTGRSPSTIERIGKKYQWIAFHQLLARLADNYRYYESSSIHAAIGKFTGAWNPNVRDIDPTSSYRQAKNKPETAWWTYRYQLPKQPMADWLKNQQELPDLKGLVEVTDANGTAWLVMENHRNWSDGERELWFQVRSYITQRPKQNKIVNWVGKQNLMGRWMPESQSRTELYLREYYWSPALKDVMVPYYGGELWQDLRGERGGNKIGEIAVSTIEYLWEKGTDKSQAETTSLLLPNQLLFDVLKLRHGTVDGHFENEAGEVVAFDPAAIYETASCLLIRKKDLLSALETAGLDIFWTGLGEKLNTGHYNKTQPELFKRQENSQLLYYENGQVYFSSHSVIPDHAG